MNLIKCFQTNSTWYKGAFRNSRPVGILWHDTGAGNSSLKRYVQPHESDSNYEEMIQLLGKNKYNNDWNHIYHEAGVNAWIGKLADGSIATAQVGEWTMAPWGCGGDKKGSCNGYIGNLEWQGVHWIQFEICDDKYVDEQYFKAVYKEACELTAYLCKEFNIDPNGIVEFNGVKVPTIINHADSYDFQLGCNHIDTRTWFRTFGYSMDNVRADVSRLMGNQNNEPEKIIFEEQDTVKIKSGVTCYTNGKTIPTWIQSANLYVREVRTNGDIVISTLREGAITGIVHDRDLIIVEKYKKEDKVEILPDLDNKQEDVIPEPDIEVDPKPQPDDLELTEDEKKSLSNGFIGLIELIIKIFARLFIGNK